MKVQRISAAVVIAAVWLVVPLITNLFGSGSDAPGLRGKVIWGLAAFGYLVIGSAVAAWGGATVGHAESRSEKFAILVAGAAVIAFWFAVVES